MQSDASGHEIASKEIGVVTAAVCSVHVVPPLVVTAMTAESLAGGGGGGVPGAVVVVVEVVEVVVVVDVVVVEVGAGSVGVVLTAQHDEGAAQETATNWPIPDGSARPRAMALVTVGVWRWPPELATAWGG